ncbi:MAG: bifunctional phosphopantothenoylcysteine decarboxylase/phosphopantothenate--cysteine ligase CoaBC [Bacteroidales bacterium]|jgi:phosphopantothenoylcysteine decarboxylase/phosphopantothenate--cysteine ligase|nr:bifunctional phosphopantothenoylcysteine decarboxylase/phosphopantothenate--cysteine ligase CoaBC [Bacteroidales bacterium]MDN5349488.1 phosphopantothenoylcysteine decarboxylase / phosphopantothenate---cysteine ligase [Bacteroidales bacterium]
MLKGKKILIGITGSIAAYKIPLLVRLLVKEQAEVKVIMSESAKDFVTPLTLATLSKNPVYSQAFDRTTGSWNSHVELGLWADLFLIAPVSANTLAKLANGIADNFILTVYLSTRCPVLFAPAMDFDMYKHESTQTNINCLLKRGHQLLAPASGELASGLCGEGRMMEPDNIFNEIKHFFRRQNAFNGKSVLVTAGPTYEAIDPVRFIGNHSSGKMGIEIAQAFADAGASVKLVLGPSAIRVEHPSIEVFPVISAQEMYDACTALFSGSDITVMSAAVADYKPVEIADRKIKKSGENLNLNLVKNPDILKKLGEQKQAGQYLVGFALETDNELKHAKQKLDTKQLDMIVLNSLADPGAGFGTNTNKVTCLTKEGQQFDFELQSKKELARKLIQLIHELTGKNQANA